MLCPIKDCRIFARVSSDKCFPRCASLNFALVSADTGALCFHASRIFALVASDIGALCFAASLNFARVSSEHCLPRCAALCFSLHSSERCFAAALCFALVSAEGLLPVFENPGLADGSYLFMQSESLITLWIV